MFENLRITSSVASDHLEINLQWKWKYTRGGHIPACEVFCCTIPENQLLHDSIFSQEEIIKWIVERKGIDIMSLETRRDNLRAYYNNPTNKSNCRINRYTLNNGGNELSVQRMEYPLKDIDKIFFICVYGEKTFESKVFAINTQEDSIPYEFVTSNKLFGILGIGKKMIRFNDSGGRRRVMISKYNNEEVYSILPGGDEYYLIKDVSSDNKVKFVYLSSLIGN